VAAVLSIVSTPRHQQKLNGHYLSSSPQYLPLFRERVRTVTGGAEFWAPQPPPG
jgi:hypothetical protein